MGKGFGRQRRPTRRPLDEFHFISGTMKLHQGWAPTGSRNRRRRRYVSLSESCKGSVRLPGGMQLKGRVFRLEEYPFFLMQGLRLGADYVHCG
jgi:hypothetical protein